MSRSRKDGISALRFINILQDIFLRSLLKTCRDTFQQKNVAPIPSPIYSKRKKKVVIASEAKQSKPWGIASSFLLAMTMGCIPNILQKMKERYG